ncbi:MAG: mannose-1-phosphate guanylyltransferase [Caldilineaceae bacterium]|nr:mannose-1-phosphate guanylyltransferase [Caldilineaceae bacterium]
MHIVILAGGVGTRLWPRSRHARPKQFSDITGDGRTMIQATVDRVAPLTPYDQIYVVTGQQYAELTAEQLPQIPKKNIIIEPSGRNTGPAIGLACMHLYKRDPNATVAFIHSDHVMTREDCFRAALQRGAAAAAEGYLVTLGIQPDSPHTGYGYIKRDSVILPAEQGEQPVYRVGRFLEKPDLATAQSFLNEGSYYWNGGIFICRVDRMLAELARQLPEGYAHLQEIGASLGAPNAEEVLLAQWEQMPNISIDHAVMEGAECVAVTPLDAGWNDVGSWDALEVVLPCDENDNCVAKGNLIAEDSCGNIVYSDKTVALIGLNDLVVVETEDALLVGPKSQMQKVKNIVEALKAQGRHDLL